MQALPPIGCSVMPEKCDTRVRLDKWLYAARFYKTRSIAAQAIESGRARVDDQRVKPSHAIKPGARISLSKDSLVWKVEVAAVSDKRGPASEAAKLYRESPESAAVREEEIARRKAAAASTPRTPGRPTKRDRRKLHSFFEEN
jgi:ribosome-associated heat shock protein Hsp15